MMHDELVRQAAAWLQRKRCVVVITEMTSAARETPDVIGWASGGQPILVECKVSRADFLRDQKKVFRQMPEYGMGARRYYFAPKGVIDPGDLPDGWGLVEIDSHGRPRRAVVSGVHERNADDEIRLLLSALRRVGQDAPDGVSVSCYTYATQNTATLGVATDNREAPR